MKKLSPLMVVHFILMLVLLLLSVASAVMLIAGVGFDFGALKTDSHVSVTLFGVFNLVNALALCFGIVYLLKGYTKKAAPLYKASLLTRVAATVICIVMMTFNFSAQGAAQALVIAIIVLLAGKGAVMAYMTFKKDIGKKNTWILFHVLVILDVGLGVLFLFNQSGLLVHTIVNICARLALDGAIGLSVRGKYKDKEKRGR